ncbi:MAG: GH116 family glycosyl-hydrolase [Kiritimatiellia bacterium]|jgi:non-lysosomal glucosylceramidase
MNGNGSCGERPGLSTADASAQALAGVQWPVVRHFDGDHLLRVALPMGGIGTGTISLSGRGEIVNWEIMNRANKGVVGDECQGDSRTFFAINVKGTSGSTAAMLAGPLHPTEHYHAEGQPVPQAGLPRFREASFDGAFPFGVVHLADRDLPVKVDIRGFSPFIPGDSADSSLPVASLEYVVENASSEALEVSIGAFLRNIVGNDGAPKGWTWKSLAHTETPEGGRTVFREGGGLRGLLCLSDGVEPTSSAWGSFALVTPDRDGALSWRETGPENVWNQTILAFWDDFTGDGELSPGPTGPKAVPHGGLCLKKIVPAGGKVSYRFAFTWNFPNRRAWVDALVGNWYSRHYTDAWDAAQKIVHRLPELEARTLAFVGDTLAIDAPDVIKEAALSNLAVLKSQTTFRIASGHLCGWEGIFDHIGSCPGSCTHVWNYENAVACLFPDLSRSMRDVEFNSALDPETGRMDFRAELPLGSPRNGRTAADGQMGCIMKAYRDWRICGDDAWLRSLWPQVKKALAFAWSEGSWDADQDGLMEGSQHNTMDVNYIGPNPQMGFWYLGALRAGEEMAKAMKDDDFAATCRRLFDKGSAAIDAKLFNGDYYEQIIPEGSEDVPFQLGKGCLVDQLVGQQMAHLWDLGDLASPANVKTTCRSIMKWNFLENFSRHFTNMRVFCTGQEAGLLMASWPRGRQKIPFPYFGEVMTGFEYVAAAEMIFQGMDAEAVKVIHAIRSRHDGLKRNPFSEPECGHHYARSMASWNCLLAWQRMHPACTG